MKIIFLVDDDEAFLTGARNIPIQNSKVFTFIDPMSAIEAFNEQKPNIIISDIQMPGIHGLKFAVIARELMRPQEFIYISANSREDVERDFGSLNPYRFFRKPLDDDFYDFIEQLPETAEVNVNDSSHTLTDHNRSNPSSPNFDSVQISHSIANLGKVFDAWKALHDYEYAALEKAGFTVDRGDRYFEEISDLETHFQTVCNVLDVDEDARVRIVAQFEAEHPSFDKRVKAYFLQNVRDCTYENPQPMDFDLSMRQGPVLTLRSFGIAWHGDELVLFLDGERSEAPKGFRMHRGPLDFETLTMIERYSTFKLLKDWHASFLSESARTLFLGPENRILRERSSFKAEIEFPETAIMGHLMTHVSFQYDQQHSLSSTSVTTPTGEFQVRYEHIPSALPESFSIKATKTVSATRMAPFEFRCTTGGREISVPLDHICADARARGRRDASNVYAREAALVRFLWQVALGQEKWQIGGRTMALSEFIGPMQSL